MQDFATNPERTAFAISAAASALRDEMHEAVARVCRPALLELMRIHKGTRISVVRSPRMPASILCVPALMSDDFHAESDLVKWLAHSGQSYGRRGEIVEHVMTILTAVAQIDACGLAPAVLVIENEDGYEGENEDDLHRGLAEIHEADVNVREDDFPRLSIEDRDGRMLVASDSSPSSAAALRLGNGPDRPVLTRAQVASLIPSLLRFVRTGSIVPKDCA
jgi:hypothetical protein